MIIHCIEDVLTVCWTSKVNILFIFKYCGVEKLKKQKTKQNKKQNKTKQKKKTNKQTNQTNQNKTKQNRDIHRKLYNTFFPKDTHFRIRIIIGIRIFVLFLLLFCFCFLFVCFLFVFCFVFCFCIFFVFETNVCYVNKKHEMWNGTDLASYGLHRVK